MVLSVATVLSGITLEPAAFLYYIAISLTYFNGQNLLLQKACNPGDTAPTTLTCQDETRSQEWVTRIQTWKNIFIDFGPVFFVLFAGPWSDKHGKRRKPLLYIPLCGQIISDLLCILNVYFWSWPPEVAALSESILPGLTGFRTCFFIGVNCYISDITEEKSRTIRLGICNAVYFLGIPIGACMFGLVFKKIGFQGVFILCVIFNTVAFAYLFKFVDDFKSDEVSTMKTWDGIIDPKIPKQLLKVVLRSRSGYLRAVVLLLVLTVPVTMAHLSGEYSVLYLFVRYKFNWDESDYGFYAAYRFIAIFCGTLVTLGVLSRLLAISDTVIGMLSCLTLIIASLGYTFSTTPLEMFVYPIVDFTHGAGLAVVNSILSKSVEDTELGQVNSMVGVVVALFPLFNLPLYSQVYNHTFTKMPGAFFLISAVYGASVLVVFGVVHILLRVQRLQEDTQENTKL